MKTLVAYFSRAGENYLSAYFYLFLYFIYFALLVDFCRKHFI